MPDPMKAPSETTIFVLVWIVSMLGCLAGPFAAAAIFGPWWGLVVGVFGYAALLMLVLIESRRRA